MQILNYRELIKNEELDLETSLYIFNSIKKFQQSDEHFYNAEETFKKVFWGYYEVFIIEDDGYKGCCATTLKLSTKGEYYVEVIFCLGEFKNKFIDYMRSLISKVQDIYSTDKPLFYKIDGRLGWSKYFKELNMIEMSRTYVGGFDIGK